MSLAGDQLLIDRLARFARNGFLYCIAQMLVIVGVMIYNVPPIAVGRAAHGEKQTGPADAAKKKADADEAYRRARWRASGTALLFDVLGVGLCAAAIAMFYAIPAVAVQFTRHRIVTENWTPPISSSEDSKLFTRDVLQSDTGKLAFMYIMWMGLGQVVAGFTTVFVVLPYLISQNPLVLGASILVVAVAASQFPTRARVAAWINCQQELLNNDRRDLLPGHPSGH
jgi:hypothetical protein